MQKSASQSNDIDAIIVDNTSIESSVQFLPEKPSAPKGKTCDDIHYYNNNLANDFKLFQPFQATNGVISLSIVEGTPELPSIVSELYCRAQRENTGEVIKEGFISIAGQESIEFSLAPNERTNVYFKGAPNTVLQITNQSTDWSIHFNDFAGRVPTELGEFTPSKDDTVKLSLLKTTWERILVDIYKDGSPSPITTLSLSLPSQPTAEFNLQASQTYVFKIYNPKPTDFNIHYCHETSDDLK
ncbi:MULTISPECIES: hypothetical protein [unclassified Pseudomonas]|uniref:hypothetical protein n=1 Tax=unclassified Pseudomonas TaxID=196821 RepID=UPI00119B2C7E|nr:MULTISPECIES: hypothetical protein [unclassified Pseudomonas]TWC10529.1 hypothetical protein FBY00_1463 [Pseudomonas sp. SJZ075]TWC26684.1 hypothetical protein FBY02_1473 [Pseudomonas sp. SJZ078]TWC45859.1 hypothetical protein FBY11_14631 [Pseudomonas sp. SJZ124]TWC46124.1 hypothetical protein FBY04_13326 [Pseudomonas sp. SJZ080]TWC81126.1 hypothetical protein FBY09_1453 [Pseudomonas sp. SJZ101]